MMEETQQNDFGQQGAPPARRSESIRVDKPFVTSIQGILKYVEVGLALISFICVEAGLGTGWQHHRAAFSFHAFLTSLTMILTTFVFFFWFFCLYNIQTVRRLPWNLVFMVYHGGATILYVISVICVLSMSLNVGAYVASGIFGLGCIAAYSVDTFFSFADWRRSPNPATTSESSGPSGSPNYAV